MTPVIDLAIRSSVILAFGLVLTACFTGRSAALRHRVLATSLFASALVLPFNLTLPAWTVTFHAPAQTASVDDISAVTTTQTSDSVTRVPATAGVPRSMAPESRQPDLSTVVVLVWMAGLVATASTLGLGLWRVRRVTERAVRVSDDRWLSTLATLARRYGLAREVVIVRSESPDLLATWGFLHPHVLVPGTALDWSADRVHVVLCHELAHVRRHDWVVQVGAEIIRAILWFNPLVWIVCTRLRRESEQACDDEVLDSGVVGRDYATHLLELARQCRRTGASWAAVLPMARPSTLERRIVAMLNPRLDRRIPSGRVLAALAAVLLGITVPIASLRARQVGPTPLSGTVYDVSAAVLPGVQVKLVDANQVELAATTTATGRFELPPVGPGQYTLDVSLAGFRPLRQPIELRDTRDWNRAITLQVSSLQETIRVVASRQTTGPAEPPAPVRVGGNLRPPRKIKDVRPIFPASMVDAGLTGVVPLEAVIGRDGTVSAVRVLSAQVHPDFAIAATDAVRQWHFTPTLLNGDAVEVVITVNVTFSLN